MSALRFTHRVALALVVTLALLAAPLAVEAQPHGVTGLIAFVIDAIFARVLDLFLSGQGLLALAVVAIIVGALIFLWRGRRS